MNSPTHMFQQDGYLVARSLFNSGELDEIRSVLKTHSQVQPCIWDKELAASSDHFLHLATHPAIIDRLKTLLGDDVIVWGASYLDRKPGQIHPWHTDIESSHPEGGFVTVWIGVDGTNQASALKVLPGSHRFNTPLQQSIQENGSTREKTSDQDVEAWASSLADSPKKIDQPDINNGDAIFFDGRLWHGSSNDNQDTIRRALLIQYAAAKTPVRIPNFKQLDWPFQWIDFPRPPCVKISGKTQPEMNSMVDKPPKITADTIALTSAVHAIDLDMAIEDGKQIAQRSLLRGRSPNLLHMAAHYSVLAPGQTPHPPHSHVDEELLIVLKGKAELHYCDGEGNITPHEVCAGDFVYYPAFHRHTIHNHSNDPVVYLMFKWVALGSAVKIEPLKLQRFKIQSMGESSVPERAFDTHDFFTQRTNHLKSLHGHVSTLQPGGGYDEHCDEHDVAIIVFEGEIEVLGSMVKAGEMVWLTAGEPHGMNNPGSEPARYLVFEFHGENCSDNYAVFKKRSIKRFSDLFKIRSSRRVVRNIRRVFGLSQT